MDGLHVGVSYAPTDRGLAPQDVARLIEERGFRSLFIPEHTHIPVSRATPWPGAGLMPASAPRQLDLMVALTAAALATTRLRIGSAVCLLPQRDTISAAKAFASIDQLSHGRLTVGVGIGWNIEELMNHGIEPVTRRAKLDEQIAGMRALWTEEEASFRGEFVAFEPSWSWPKPVQERLPVLLGARPGPRTFDTIVRHADGWLPFPSPQLGAQVADLSVAWKAGGRAGDPDIIAYGVSPELSALEAVCHAGATEALLLLDDEGEADIARRLDGWAQLLL